MAMTKDDVYMVLDHMVSSEYPESDTADMDMVAEHISNYIEANIDDFMEMYEDYEDE